jgi:uncharacterized protein YprB with RNaseH-like and TPR domain
MGLRRGVPAVQRRSRRRRRAIETLLSGDVVDTTRGAFFLHRERYGLDYVHGALGLSKLLIHEPRSVALLARDHELGGVEFSRMAFVDTETTGLAGGTGTYAFLVGVGVFEGEEFVVHQFFMRDHGEESALLHALGELLDGLEAVVSFNGKSFDMPLLETRFIMTRQVPRLTDAPHLDLLPVARRFWKYRLDSCALSSLEDHVLGVRRNREDVPGYLIPGLYLDYVRNGDAGEMPGIFYHNAQDILSLVTLTAHMCDLLANPLSVDITIPEEDLYGLARLLLETGQFERAELAYAHVAQTSRASQVKGMAMRDLAFLLKRQERRSEALAWWQRLVETEDAIIACEELAKHYEWHDADLAQALAWTERGIGLAKAWAPGAKRRETLAALEHRRLRLQRKVAAADS